MRKLETRTGIVLFGDEQMATCCFLSSENNGGRCKSNKIKTAGHRTSEYDRSTGRRSWRPFRVLRSTTSAPLLIGFEWKMRTDVDLLDQPRASSNRHGSRKGQYKPWSENMVLQMLVMPLLSELVMPSGSGNDINKFFVTWTPRCFFMAFHFFWYT